VIDLCYILGVLCFVLAGIMWMLVKSNQSLDNQLAEYTTRILELEDEVSNYNREEEDNGSNRHIVTNQDS